MSKSELLFNFLTKEKTEQREGINKQSHKGTKMI